ncbi:MAG: peptidoglycan DD-metalloendopeptidase family protein [Microscillaceae bacterium]|nr:peptidoglycan DD-metalloendopeptidase family protein [Microscillaceae bacterium]MDW8461320.1 peptidoglycan DD-metalloendopeptidase family protein [Cytophagales bacterium]
MGRIKYYYNPETCRYERVKTRTIDVIINLLGFFTLSLILAVGLTMLYGKYYKTEQEIMLKKENEELLLHYELLNKQITEANEMLKALQHRDDNIYRVVFEADPIPTSVREAGSGGSDKYKDLLKKGLKQEEIIIGTLKKIDQLKRKMYVQSKSYDEIAKLVKNKSKMLASIPAIQPISNKELTRLSSGFGIRIHPIYKVAQFHPGVDFAAPHGTPIYASGSGTIVKAEYMGGYGNTIIIDHGYGYETLYAHMSAFKVEVGQKVKRGECIGYIGSTGFSTAPHLHYEVIYKGEKVNPVYYFFNDLTPEEYDKILKLASAENQSLS